MPLLEVRNLASGYGQFQALFEVSLQVEQGAAISVIGANGAGKSTLLKSIAGTVDVISGEIIFDGQSIVNWQPHQRLRSGIALVPEGRRIFRSLTVDENLKIGAFAQRSGPWTRDLVYQLFPMLGRLSNRTADKLSGGEQQALAFGRALMSNPRLLLLDEVSLGLAPIIVKQLYEVLPTIRDQGCSLIIVEQDTNQALLASDFAYCLLEGRVSLEGKPANLDRQQIATAYFGVGVN